ncbi:MAG: HK97-gp10 family putative phage morphogenesis protein [Plesiomonas sp.]
MINIQIEGLSALSQALDELGNEVASRVLARAGRKAMQPVRDAMRQSAGYDESNHGQHMRDTIKIRSIREDGERVIRVGPQMKAPHYIKARAQEYGTTKQLAKPFIRPALDNNIQLVGDTLREELGAGIMRAQRRIAAKNK